MNKEIAKIFYEISDILRTGPESFRPIAYRRAGDALMELDKDVKDIYEKGGIRALEEIHGIGGSLAEKIEEYIKKGKIKYYFELKKELPISLDELTRVEGVGPKKARILFEKLKIKNVKDLEKAAKAGKIAPLDGFGEKSEENILQGIEFFKRSKGRFLLGKIMPTVLIVKEKLEKLKEVKKVSVAGSLRRGKETIGDVDFLAVSDEPEKVADFFATLPGIEKVWGKGATKVSVRLKEGFDMDLRIVPSKSYGSALQYFTGSVEHNIATRQLAMAEGMKLNEYGIFKGKDMVASATEEDVYKAIGLPVIPPEIRENEGEIEAGLAGKLPVLIERKDIKGDLHCHSSWDGGKHSIKEMAEMARKMGYQYIGISDHTKFLKIENGLNEEQLLEQRKEIDKLNEGYRDFKILQGCEANILKDGKPDVSEEALKKLDYVIAGIHSNMKMEKDEMTERLITAMRNKNIDIIAHPTGRIIGKRDEYAVDFERVLQVAKETGTILEINSWPERLDLKDKYVRMAKEAGVKMIINTDSHEKDHMSLISYGIITARRGWAEKSDIINTSELKDLKFK